MLEEKETLTAEDLDRVFIRVQEDDSAKWVSISAKAASDLQFSAWAKSRIEIRGDDLPWSQEERAKFCNMLWQADALAVLKKGVNLDE